MNFTGKTLNILWNVNAIHALYRADGTWYHLLTSFPAALFDENGYVLFETQQEYTSNPYLQIKKHTHVPNGISAMPTYVFKEQKQYIASDLDEPNTPNRNSYLVSRIIRDTVKARKVKLLHDNTCQVCGMKLMLQSGLAYSEAHHIRPLGSHHTGPDREENLICVCPNCHAQLDYGAIPLDKELLRSTHGHCIADEYLDYHNTNIYEDKK